MVSADQMVRFIFNNGTEPSPPPCSSADDAMIDALFVDRRRRVAISNNDTVSRRLFTYPQKCKENCLGIKACRATGCHGYDGTIGRKNRNLQSICDSVLSSINQKLDTLAVSSTCKAFLHKNNRKGECYNDVRYGEVVGAKLWTLSGGSQTSQDIPASGLSFCRSKMINIEALGNPCVDYFGIDIAGPNGYKFQLHSEKYPPYSIFGDDGVSKFVFKTLPHVGTYVVTLQPDNYPEKEKKYTFTVNSC